MPGDRDPRVGGYIAQLPPWQRELCEHLREVVHGVDPVMTETIERSVRPSFVLQGDVCALPAAEDHVDLFLYDGGQVPDPDGLATAGHDNVTADRAGG